MRVYYLRGAQVIVGVGMGVGAGLVRHHALVVGVEPLVVLRVIAIERHLAG